MSSPEFEAKLRPDYGIRRIVLSAGLLAMLVGVVLIMFLNVPILWRLAATAVWMLDCLWGFWALIRGARQVAWLWLDSNGRLDIVDAEGFSRPARLLTGSLVLRNVAWLRVRLPDGRRYAELLIASRVDAGAWHRLQLIWQQCRDAFGQMVRA